MPAGTGSDTITGQTDHGNDSGSYADSGTQSETLQETISVPATGTPTITAYSDTLTGNDASSSSDTGSDSVAKPGPGQCHLRGQQLRRDQ